MTPIVIDLGGWCWGKVPVAVALGLFLGWAWSSNWGFGLVLSCLVYRKLQDPHTEEGAGWW